MSWSDNLGMKYSMFQNWFKHPILKAFDFKFIHSFIQVLNVVKMEDFKKSQILKIN